MQARWAKRFPQEQHGSLRPVGTIDNSPAIPCWVEGNGCHRRFRFSHVGYVGRSGLVRTNLSLPRRTARVWSLKGSHKSAQGNALGIEAEYNVRAPKGRNNLRGNSKLFRPFRACGHVRSTVPRALPWAGLLRPLRGES